MLAVKKRASKDCTESESNGRTVSASPNATKDCAGSKLSGRSASSAMKKIATKDCTESESNGHTVSVSFSAKNRTKSKSKSKGRSARKAHTTGSKSSVTTGSKAKSTQKNVPSSKGLEGCHCGRRLFFGRKWFSSIDFRSVPHQELVVPLFIIFRCNMYSDLIFFLPSICFSLYIQTTRK